MPEWTPLGRAAPGERSDAVVFFGAPGDLAHKQVFPALARLIKTANSNLPSIGVARHGDEAMLRDRAQQCLAANGPDKVPVVLPPDRRPGAAFGRFIHRQRHHE